MEEVQERRKQDQEKQTEGRQQSEGQQTRQDWEEQVQNREPDVTHQDENGHEKATDEFVAEGFSFYTQADMELAIQERKKIGYLKARMDYSKPEDILHIYEKAISDRVFKTPIGMSFLKELQDILLEDPTVSNEEIHPIPLHMLFDGDLRRRSPLARARIQPSVKKEKNSLAFSISVLLNIVLVVAVIAMFVITLNSDQPNILNYEKVIVNQYAEWEQQLTERERAIREKEREIGMENE